MGRVPLPRCAFVLVLVLALASAQAGLGALCHARSAQARTPAEVPQLKIHLVGGLCDASGLAALMEEWLDANRIAREMDCQPRLELDDITGSGAGGVAVQVWIRMQSPRLARLYFAKLDASRYLVRDVRLERGLDEVGRELLVQVLLASTLAFTEDSARSSLAEVESALAGSPEAGSLELPADPAKTADGSAERPRAAESAESPAVTRTEAPAMLRGLPAHEAFVGAGYTVTGVASGLAHGAAFGGDALWSLGHLGAGLWLAGQYRLPHVAPSERIELTLQEITAAAGVLLAARSEPRVGWHLRFGAGVEWIDVRPRAMVEGVAVRDGGRFAVPFATFSVGPVWRQGGVRLRAALAVDVLFDSVYYDVLEDGVRSHELRVGAFQPSAVVEFGASPIPL